MFNPFLQPLRSGSAPYHILHLSRVVGSAALLSIRSILLPRLLARKAYLSKLNLGCFDSPVCLFQILDSFTLVHDTTLHLKHLHILHYKQEEGFVVLILFWF